MLQLQDILENGYAELIKEIEDNRKRIRNITICNSKQLGKALMEEIKTIQEYVFKDQSTEEHAGKESKNETSPFQTKIGKTMIKHSPVDDTEGTDQPEDMVI